MTDNIIPVQTETQSIIKRKIWKKSEDAMLWVEVSIANKVLKRSEIAELCSGLDMKKRSAETWRQYYYEWRETGFEEYWLGKFKDHFRNKLGAKIYGRMDDLVDREKDLSKLVSVGEFLQEKKQGVNVQINNLIAKEKNEYGI